MKSGYDQFFKDARKAANHGSTTSVKFNKNPKASAKPSRLHLDLASEDIEQQLRRRMKVQTPKRKKRSGIPWKIVSASFLGLMLAVWGFENHEDVEKMLKRVEVQWTGEAYAEAPAAKGADAAAKKAAVDAALAAAVPASPAAVTSADLDHLQKLNERKKELDAREEELNRMETELQAQKGELEKRMTELEAMRGKISTVLEDRVKVDDQKVDTLVQMYSQMKAPQAAKVFETMDEDLAVEILGRMKKKNAADIMNLLKPEKAQVLSEMFAGFKRRSPASSR